MGLDWELTLRNRKTGEELPLMHACGWGTRDMLMRIQTLGKLDGETAIDENGNEYTNDGYYYEIDTEKFANWALQGQKVMQLLAKVSRRKIDDEDIPQDIFEKVLDVYYDMDMPFFYDSLYPLERCINVAFLIKYGCLLGYYAYDDWYLRLNASW